MQPIAAWLVARPQNAVLGLAATLMLPFAQVFSGAVMVMIAIHSGFRVAALQGSVAVLALALLALVIQASALEILVNALVAWGPVLLLTVLLRQSRSLTLTLQVSVIVAMLVTLGFYVALGDPTEFWKGVLNDVAAVFQQAGLTEQADLLVGQRDVIAPQLTVLMVLVTWSMYSLVLVMGYAMYQALPGTSGRYGRFCDLNFGRVLALVMAIMSVLALITGAAWVQNFAFVVFVIFWVQGLAMLHWLRVDGPLPLFALIVIYAMLPVLNALLVIALAVLGYTDAWFDYRSRIRKNKAR